MKHFVRSLGIAVAALAAVAAGPAAADNYPSKPVKLVVPFPPGGTSDNLARLLAAGLQSRLGQPFIVENRGGGGTIIGTQYAIKSDPDGYTLFWMTAPYAINATLYKKLPYDTKKDLIPVVDVASVPLVLITHPSLPVKSVQELVKLAKEKPGGLTYGSSGNGGSPHLTTELFASIAGIKMVHVPYKGSAPAVTDLIGGQTDLVFDTLFLTTPHVKDGRARALAQTGSKRHPLLPDVPTMHEAGITDFDATSWFKLSAPAGTPANVIALLNKTANDVLSAPDVRENMIKQGLEPMGGTQAESARHLLAEIEKWGKAVRQSGATAE